MVVPPDPPDSNNPPTASTAGEQPGSDLTLNGPTPAADLDAVPDLRLEPEVDPSSTLVPKHVPLERRDSVPPGALTQAQPPRVDVFWAGDADPSWWSRLRSLKASWQSKHFRPSTHDDPVTESDVPRSADRTGDADRSWVPPSRSLKASRETKQLPPGAHDEPLAKQANSNLESHLDELAELRDVCESIDQRLARVEEASKQKDGVTIDETLHDLSSQIYERLVRVETAVHRMEGFVTEKPWDLSTIAHKRLERVEETLRLTQKSLADSPLPEMCVNIEKQLAQARMAIQRTEEAVADKTLHDLCENIDARLRRSEDTLLRREDIVAEWLQELSARMTTRFAGAEETIQRIERIVSSRTVEQTPSQPSEGIVAERLQELSAHMTARFAEADEAIQRVERMVSSRTVEQMTARFVELEETIQRIERMVSISTLEPTPPQQASVRMDPRPVQAEEIARSLERLLGHVPAGVGLRSRAVLARAALFLSRFVDIEQMNRPIRQPWMATLAVSVLVLVAAVAIGAQIRPSRGVATEKVVPLTTTDQISTPAVPAPNQGVGAPSTTAIMANAPRSTGESRVSAPQGRPPRALAAPDVVNRESAPTNTQPRFVGTLSITSVPSGAAVSINGKPAGVTPLRLPRQRAGSLAVQIAHDGFERWSAAVLVPAGGLAEVTARLRATAR